MVKPAHLVPSATSGVIDLDADVTRPGSQLLPASKNSSSTVDAKDSVNGNLNINGNGHQWKHEVSSLSNGVPQEPAPSPVRTSRQQSDTTGQHVVAKPRVKILPDLDPAVFSLARPLPELHPLSCPLLQPTFRKLTLRESMTLNGVSEFLEAWGGEVDLFDEEDDVEKETIKQSVKDKVVEGKVTEEDFRWGTFGRLDARFASLEHLLYQNPEVRLPTLSALYSRLTSLATSDDLTLTTLATPISFAGLVEIALSRTRPDLSAEWRSSGFPHVTPAIHAETLGSLVDLVMGTEKFRAAVNAAAEAVQDFSKHRWARSRRRKELELECAKKEEVVERLASEMDANAIPEVADGSPGDDTITQGNELLSEYLPRSSTREQTRADSKVVAHRRELRRVQLEYRLAAKDLDNLRRQLRKIQREGEDDVGEKERLSRRVRGARWCRRLGWDRFGRCWWWWEVVPGAERDTLKGKKKPDKEKSKDEAEDIFIVKTDSNSKSEFEDPARMFGVLVEDQVGSFIPVLGSRTNGLSGRKRATPDVMSASRSESPTVKRAKMESGDALPTGTIWDAPSAAGVLSPHPKAASTGPIDLSGDSLQTPAVRSRLAFPATLADLSRALSAFHDRGQRERPLRAALEEELQMVGIEVKGKHKELAEGDAKDIADRAYQRFAAWVAERGAALDSFQSEHGADPEGDIVMSGGTQMSSRTRLSGYSKWDNMIIEDIRRLTERSCEIMGVQIVHAHAACAQTTPVGWCSVYRQALEARLPPRNSIRSAIEIMDKIGHRAGAEWTWERIVLYLEEATTVAEQIQRRNARDRTKGRTGEVILEDEDEVLLADNLQDPSLRHDSLESSLLDLPERKRGLRSAAVAARVVQSDTQVVAQEEDDELEPSLRGYSRRRAATKAERATKQIYVSSRAPALHADVVGSSSRSSGKSHASITRKREAAHASKRRKSKSRGSNKTRSTGVETIKSSAKGLMMTPPRSDDAGTSEIDGTQEEDANIGGDGSEYEKGSNSESESAREEVSGDDNEYFNGGNVDDRSDQGEFKPPINASRRGKARPQMMMEFKPRTPRKPRGERKQYGEESSEDELDLEQDWLGDDDVSKKRVKRRVIEDDEDELEYSTIELPDGGERRGRGKRNHA
ncbi:hypothetical protein HDU93_008706 [Gonapodya sp. JEL0774]|nr:hypothetical protein HDU93_008706 [Gonapodya sp. JEL0774]